MSKATPEQWRQWYEYTYRNEEEALKALEQGLPCPHDLFRVAASNVVVASYLQVWRRGACTFEQALIGMVTSLAERNDVLTKNLVENALRNPSREPIVVPRNSAEAAHQ